MKQREKPQQLVKSLDRALDILEKLVETGEPVGVTELSNSLGLHKSTVYRLLATLNYRGYVEQEEKTSNYKTGLKLFEIGSTVLNNLDLRTQARPHLNELMQKTGETIHLGILDHYEVVYIDKVESSETIRMYSSVGRRIPAHCTSLGKVILAHSKSEFVEELIAKKGLPAYTSNTITSGHKLKQNLARIKKQGYGVDDREQDQGIRCIAGPIFNHDGEILGAFSISGPAMRMTEERVEELIPLVISYSRKISSSFGYNQF